MRKRGKRIRVTVAEAQGKRLQVAAQQAEHRYMLNHQPVTNLDKVIEFELDGMWMRRRLVPVVRQIGEEISIASPVGFTLANAQPGQEFVITRPDPNEYSIVKVLSIAESVA